MKAPQAYAELAVTTNYSFLRGASHPGEYVEQAAALRLQGLGIADRNSLAGIVRAYAHVREKELEKKLKLIVGTRLVFCDGTPDMLAYPKNRAAYGALTGLLTRGNARAEKGGCLLSFEDLASVAQDMQLAVMPRSTFRDEDNTPSKRFYPELSDGDDNWQREEEKLALSEMLPCLREACGGPVWLAAAMTYGARHRSELAWRKHLAEELNAPLLAVNDVLMHVAERRPLHDVVTAIRLGVTLDEAGRALEANAERHLKSPAEMARLFSEAPQAIGETIRFLEGISFSLSEIRGDYPEELRAGHATPQDALRAFTYEGADKRFEHGIPDKVKTAIEHELEIVARLEYAPYFLTVHDIMHFAKTKGILCQGRGSAANSTLCYCLGITDVDPRENQLLFERFISEQRNEPPDIDVDFEHERREEVMEYIYEHYGRAHAALTATVVSYRSRSALREVGKVFGFSEDTLSALSGLVWGRSTEGIDEKEARRLGLDPNEPRLEKVLDLAHQLNEFPRHLSQHTGGFVITRSRLDTIVPLSHATMEKRTTIEWDKDDLDALHLLKVDVLALGMLTCLKRGFDLLKTHYERDLTLHYVLKEEGEKKPVYDMISNADTIGVFQVESRAQMSMLPRLRPQKFYDLVIEVAIVRPGPIQGDMVHPYLRRRQNIEPVHYPSVELQEVLERTLGVPLFQEQAMQIAIVAAGFTPNEADKLRRAMATFKRVGTINTFEDKMIKGMVKNGYEEDFAQRCFKQIEGFGTYGFPESHAASFALLVYVSAWMKCFYPDVFCCALLNAQPMGFYAPAQLVRDAREHGVIVEEPDLNFSDWDSSLVLKEAGEAAPLHPRHALMQGQSLATHKVRLGFRQIKSLNEADMEVLIEKRGAGYDSIRDLWLRTGLQTSVLERLAEADAFTSLGLSRRDALWAIKGLNRAGDKDDLPLLRSLSFKAVEPDADQPPMLPGEEVIADYRSLSLSLKAHPVSFVRRHLAARKIIEARQLTEIKNGAPVIVAGLVLVRQRPGTSKGVIFLTLEDETGIANAVIWPRMFETYRPIIMGGRFLAVRGKVQAESNVIHVVADRAEDLTPLLTQLTQLGQDNMPREDNRRPDKQDAEVRRVMPKGRNFH